MEELEQKNERALENQDTSELLNIEMFKAHKITALPPLKRKLKKMRAMPGVSYLSTSGLYEDMMGSKKNFQIGHMTRRNITEHRISTNIMSHNTPVAHQNFDSLNLGPQHRKFRSTFDGSDI